MARDLPEALGRPLARIEPGCWGERDEFLPGLQESFFYKHIFHGRAHFGKKWHVLIGIIAPNARGLEEAQIFLRYILPRRVGHGVDQC